MRWRVVGGGEGGKGGDTGEDVHGGQGGEGAKDGVVPLLVVGGLEKRRFRMWARAGHSWVTILPFSGKRIQWHHT